MTRKIFTGAIHGLDAVVIEVEADVANGLPQINIVGLPDTAVQESRQRVRAALKNSGCQYPQSRITVNLAPADLNKTGAHFDLPIALSILLASGQIEFSPVQSMFAGELSLDGAVRPVQGVMAMVLMARDAGKVDIFVPAGNADEAVLVDGVRVYPVETLLGLLNHLSGAKPIFPCAPSPWMPSLNSADIGFSAIRGQHQAKRGLEIAAAGGHNILLCGPPGSGKTLLARAFADIMPALTRGESLELTKIYSAAGRLENGIITTRPVRRLHHTASPSALVGGGLVPRPGEVTLAHRGILFLDEFPEFARGALEALRQPLEDGVVTIARHRQTFTFPAQFILVAAMNPCPCGYHGDSESPCSCSPAQINGYRKKISGPLLDRIDICVSVPRLSYAELRSPRSLPKIAAAEKFGIKIKHRISEARSLQYGRFGGPRTNREMSNAELETFCRLDSQTAFMLETAAERYRFSARTVHRVLKVARTIADLDQKKAIFQAHIAEALQYKLVFEK